MAMWTMSVLLLAAIIMTGFARPLSLFAFLFAAGSALVFAGFMAVKHHRQQVWLGDVHRLVYMAFFAAVMYCVNLDSPRSLEQLEDVFKFFFFIAVLITIPYFLVRVVLKTVRWFKLLFKAA